MSEPEEVILDGAHIATEYVARLWRRHTKDAPVAGLADARRRLETLLAALYENPLPIVPAEAPARSSLFGRLARRTPRHLVDLRALPSTDGVRIRLPRQLDASADDGMARYRLLALVQAARAARGTSRLVPDASEPDVRDLYLLSEAAASDREIVGALPGVAPDLYRARLADRKSRPRDSLLTRREREAERLMRAVLASSPDMNPVEVPFAPAPVDSLAWARAAASRIALLGGRYRGLRAIATWGRIDSPPGAVPFRAPGSQENPSLIPTAAKRVRTLVRRPRVRDASEDEDDPQTGMWMIQLDDPKEHVEDPMGLQRPADRDAEANADDLADSVSELAEARLVSVPGAPTEMLVSEDPPDRRAVSAPPSTSPAPGIAYPEWDWRVAAYHPAWAVVHEVTAPQGDRAWALQVLRSHAREVAAVRRQFERLRARRVRLMRQLDGDDLDLDAFVAAWADDRAGSAADDRLYERIQPERRDVAISLLVDVSGSTDSWIADRRRIIDVEKEALLLACEALDALGDRYNVLAFSGEGPRGVVIRVVKGFGEGNGAVRERIAGLEHDRYTRLGAAVRHATAALSRERARHRLLLVLSDGKPNDVDEYEGRYGVEDARQAVAEARLQELSPFCLTVDREAPVYLPRIFGPGAYAVLRRADRLPTVLVDVVRRLLKR